MFRLVEDTFCEDLMSAKPEDLCFLNMQSIYFKLPPEMWAEIGEQGATYSNTRLAFKKA